ncbi:hypothetical protein PIB30_079917 [Stylosanthes scabra]|uniref:Uncharacterized protein n=1 Tax=Stylosanthes scabra TaxID=79078 RepID=A0ABU6QS54_9FABA|nr:hypothetical protein [Stylosanthes scabra]
MQELVQTSEGNDNLNYMRWVSRTGRKLHQQLWRPVERIREGESSDSALTMAEGFDGDRVSERQWLRLRNPKVDG